MAKVQTNFPQRFAIYNLDRFISTLSLFENPELTFGEKYVTISTIGRKINYTYADENTVIKVPDKDINLPDSDVTFTLTPEAFKDIQKASGILALPEILVIGDGTNMYLQVADTKNPSGDTFSIDIGESDKKFKSVFKFENLKIIPDTYTVQISSKKISLFNGNVAQYYIAIEDTSSF